MSEERAGTGGQAVWHGMQRGRLPSPPSSVLARRALEIALAAIAAATVAGAPRALAGESTEALVFWYGLVVVTSLIPLSLPGRGRDAIAPATTPVFALGLVLGPAAAALAGLVSGFVSGLVGGRTWRDRLHLSTRLAVAAWVGARLFVAGGGHPYPWGVASSLFEFDVSDALPLALASTGFLVAFLGAGALFIAVEEGLSPLRVVQGKYRGLVSGPASFLILGIVMAALFLRVGWGSTLLVVPCMLVTQGTLKSRLDLERARAGAIRALTSAIDARDAYTRGHSERMARYSVRVARHLNLPEEAVEAIEIAALLHDLGKVSLDPEVLARPHQLTPEEKALVSHHVDAGTRVMRELDYLARHADMVGCHHERPDGTGYPRGLRGEEIPFGARIIKVLDAFDAMTSDRPYRNALPLRTALDELARGAGTEFDEMVVAAVVELVEQGDLVPPGYDEDGMPVREARETVRQA